MTPERVKRGRILFMAASSAASIEWYFDFISPYAYLQWAAHRDLFERTDVVLRPVVFAGLLKHWGHKGPVEMPGKRVHTYRQVTWLARERGIAFRFPPAHPFNPIHALRLALALDSSRTAVDTIFAHVWRDGRSLDADWPALCERLGVASDWAALGEPAIKDKLRANGEAAIAAGVFGVPTFVTDGHLFWGEDATPMLRDYLADRSLFATVEMQRLDALPVAAARIA
jgi:2-hydroxychromene-2-carboxylate isomerase